MKNLSTWWAHLVAFFLFVWHVWILLSRLGLTGKPYKGKKMQLQKAFDPAPLIAALEAKGIKDAEQLVNDELPVVFDWLNSSVGMVAPLPYGAIAVSVLGDLEAKALAEIAALEAKVG